MRKALLENENVGKIAGDKKKAAFLRAIEDRDEEDEEGMEFLDERGGENEGESQDLQGATQEIPESQIVEKNDVPTIAGQKRKRPLQESGPSTINRPAPRERRSKIAKRPATLAEIRESLSFLTETPESMSFTPVSESSDHEEANSAADSDVENQPQNDKSDTPIEIIASDASDPTMKAPLPPPPRQRRRPNPNNAVIDRLSLLRQQSSSTTTTTTGPTAFAVPSLSAAPSLSHVPALLRKATFAAVATEASAATATGVTTTTTIASMERQTSDAGAGAVRKRGSKKSSILYQAREAERRKAVVGVEERRRKDRERVAGRARGKGLRGLGGGEGSWGD